MWKRIREEQIKSTIIKNSLSLMTDIQYIKLITTLSIKNTKVWLKIIIILSNYYYYYYSNYYSLAFEVVQTWPEFNSLNNTAFFGQKVKLFFSLPPISTLKLLKKGWDRKVDFFEQKLMMFNHEFRETRVGTTLPKVTVWRLKV